MKTSELSKRIYDVVVEEVETIYPQFMKKVNNIDLDYFEDIVRDSEEMPKELNFELREKVLDDVKLYAMQLLEKSNIKSRIDAIMHDVDAESAATYMCAAFSMAAQTLQRKNCKRCTRMPRNETCGNVSHKATRAMLWSSIMH